MNPSIILIGGGGHCRSCIDVLEQEKKFKIAGVVEKKDGPRKHVLGYPVLGFDKELPKLRTHFEYALITIGHIKSSEARKNIYSQLIELDFNLPIVVSPNAYLSKHAVIGLGTIIMHDTLVNSGAQIGKNCIVNSKSLIEHDVLIENHCHIATGCIINGGVRVGQESFVGSGSVVREGVKIGPGSFVAGGTRVMRDLPPNSNYKNSL